MPFAVLALSYLWSLVATSIVAIIHVPRICLQLSQGAYSSASSTVPSTVVLSDEKCNCQNNLPFMLRYINVIQLRGVSSNDTIAGTNLYITMKY